MAPKTKAARAGAADPVTPPPPPDMKLIQTRVPPAVLAAVRAEATRRGLSMASWLRQHLIELSGVRIGEVRR